MEIVMKHTAAVSCLAALVVAAFAGSAEAQSSTRAAQPPAAARTTTTAPPARAADDRPLPPAVVSTGDYRVGPGDKLNIVVYKDQQLSGPVQIRPDGKITIPLLGDMSATGMTPTELSEAITKQLREYINNPVVNVVVLDAVSYQVTVIGEVMKPGAIPLGGPTNILQALALAGGFKDFANTKDIRIMRPTASGMETLRFNYKDAVDGLAKPVMLRSGDTIVVK
jgi:polysaccharide export outer membrane protein